MLISQSPQTLVAFNHYSSYHYTLSLNKQVTGLIRYSDFRSKSPVIIPILQTDNSYHVFPRLLEGIVDAAQNVIDDELKKEQEVREVVDDPASNILKMPVLPKGIQEA